MGSPIDRTAKAALDSNLANGNISDAPKIKANDDVLYNYVDGLNAAQDAHAAAAILPHADGAVTGPKIRDGAVTTAKIADLAVTQAKIANGAIGVNQLATGLAVSADVNAQFAKRGVDVTSSPYNAVGDGITDDTTAFNSAMATGGIVFIPKQTFKISGTVTIPNNTIVLLFGTLTGAGNIICTGKVVIQGTGTISLNVPGGNSLELQGESDVVGISLKSASSATAAIGIFPHAAVPRLEIRHCYFEAVNYGILKQGSAPFDYTITNIRITENTFYNLSADAIEWNVAKTDRRLTISRNTIDTINSAGTAFQGIGIGIAGGGYGSTTRIKEIVVSDNNISNVRQGIHFEACDQFEVRNNRLTAIRNDYSVSSTLDAVGIVIYGCKDFTIEDNDLYGFTGASGIATHSGAVASVYTEQSRNYVVARNTLNNAGNIISFCGGAFDAILKGNTLINGSAISHKGACYLTVEGNTIITPTSQATGLTIDYSSSDGEVSLFNMSKYRKASIQNNTVTDLNGVPYVTLSNMNIDNLLASGNNFAATSIESNKKEVQRIFYTTQASFPYGIEFQVGDIVISTTTPSRWLVTVAGSLNRSTDTFAISDAALGIVYSTNYVWTDLSAGGHHEMGQRITLSNIGAAGASLQAVVKRVTVNAGQYRIELDRTIPTSASGTITASNPITFVSI